MHYNIILVVIFLSIIKHVIRQININVPVVGQLLKPGYLQKAWTIFFNFIVRIFHLRLILISSFFLSCPQLSFHNHYLFLPTNVSIITNNAYIYYLDRLLFRDFKIQLFVDLIQKVNIDFIQFHLRMLGIYTKEPNNLGDI